MATITSNRSFIRDPLPGFFRRNRPSSDAITALESCSGSHSDRKFEVTVDEDDFLHATLHFDELDTEAGPQLQDACWAHGVTSTQFRT